MTTDPAPQPQDPQASATPAPAALASSASPASPASAGGAAQQDLAGDDNDPVLPGLSNAIRVSSTATIVLAVLAAIYTLHWAREVFIPVMLAVLTSYALSPIVDRMERLRLPRAAAAGLLLAAILGALGGTTYVLADDAAEFVELLPQAAQKIRQIAREQRHGPDTPLDNVQEAAAQLEKAADEGSKPVATAKAGVTRVQIERPLFNLKDYLWTLTPGLLASIAQLVVVVFITYFLLAAGNTFKRKLVHWAGPTLSARRITLQAVNDMRDQIERYLLLQVLLSLLVGVVTALAYWAVGMDNAAVWGVIACVLNFIPYIGSLAISAGSTLVAFVQFGTLEMAAAVGGLSIVLHTITGNLIAPWLTGRANKMNPVAVFVGVVAFGWLWGMWGLLLGVPILLIVKTVCDHVEDLKPIGELLGADQAGSPSALRPSLPTKK
jgi:predicted PurR-regulated permease PerM